MDRYNLILVVVVTIAVVVVVVVMDAGLVVVMMIPVVVRLADGVVVLGPCHTYMFIAIHCSSQLSQLSLTRVVTVGNV